MPTLAQMQRVDRLLGPPLVRLLSAGRRPSRCLPGDAPRSAPRRVVVAKFVGIGSVALTTPLLRALKDAGARIGFWTFPGPASLVAATGLADALFVIDPQPRRFASSLWRTLRDARAFAPDLFLDLEPTAHFSALLAFLSGAPVRVGFATDRSARERLFTRKVRLRPTRPMLLQMQDVGILAGLEAIPESFPDLPVLEGAPWLRDLLNREPPRRRIVINVTTSELGRNQRMWPTESWVAVITELLREPSLQVCLTGVASERAPVQAILARLPLPSRGTTALVDLTGRTSLADVLVLLRATDVVVSVDSALVHLAALCDTPVVALFGPDTPLRWAPRHARARSLYAALPCSPCCTFETDKRTTCRDNQCMKQISPDAVLAAIRDLLGTAQRR